MENINEIFSIRENLERKVSLKCDYELKYFFTAKKYGDIDDFYQY